MLLKITQNSDEKHLCQLQLYTKRDTAQMLSCEICEVSKKTSFYSTPLGDSFCNYVFFELFYIACFYSKCIFCLQIIGSKSKYALFAVKANNMKKFKEEIITETVNQRCSVKKCQWKFRRKVKFTGKQLH